MKDLKSAEREVFLADEAASSSNTVLENYRRREAEKFFKSAREYEKHPYYFLVLGGLLMFIGPLIYVLAEFVLDLVLWPFRSIGRLVKQLAISNQEMKDLRKELGKELGVQSDDQTSQTPDMTAFFYEEDLVGSEKPKRS